MKDLSKDYEILLYRSKDGDVKIDVLAQNDTLWLTQKRMAELFAVQVPAIAKHLKNILETKELDAFLRFNDYEVLDNPGNVSAEIAKTLAEKEYEQFRIEQDQQHKSDFDKLVEQSKIASKTNKNQD